MSQEDWAIVVGIWHYPALGDLSGPQNDAQAFYDWLVLPTGGGVPPEQIQLVLTPTDLPAKDIPVSAARPAAAQIQEAFDHLLDVADQRERDGKGLRVGRRLYVYLAGHGFEPQPDQTALLTANATRQRPGYHFIGRDYVRYFRSTGFFTEYVMFMDCCRESYPQVAPSVMPYTQQLSSSPPTGGWLHGYATKSTRLSREKPIEGKTRGVFTTALLAGLNGGAAEPSGEVSAASLSNYLYEHMKDWLTPAELNDPDIPQRPDMSYDSDTASRLVLVSVAPAEYQVLVQTPADGAGQRLSILNGSFVEVYEQPLTGDFLTLKLPQGFYLAQLAGKKVTFRVPASAQGGPTHVTL